MSSDESWITVRAECPVWKTGFVVLTIEDKGGGFSLDRIQNEALYKDILEPGKGRGLKLISIIMRVLGGDFKIEFTDEGTRVQLWIPRNEGV